MATNAVSVKLPPFWPEMPEFWFAQVEAEFAIKGIKTDETKYQYVMTAIDQNSAKRIMDFIKAPPVNDKYPAIKSLLIRVFSLSETQRASRLLHMPGLGDSTPSLLMDSMLNLLGDHRPCFLFRQLFIEQMPEEIRPHLASRHIEDCRKLAEAADELCAAGTNAQINVARRSQPPKPRPRFQNRQLCYYHATFGKKAHKCVPPCNFDNPENGKADRQ